MNNRVGLRKKLQRLGESALVEVPIDQAKLNGMSRETRYAYALLPHVFHKLSVLQKLLLRSALSLSRPPFVKAVQICQNAKLFKILAGKLYEAGKRFSDRATSRERIRDAELQALKTCPSCRQGSRCHGCSLTVFGSVCIFFNRLKGIERPSALSRDASPMTLHSASFKLLSQFISAGIIPSRCHASRRV